MCDSREPKKLTIPPTIRVMADCASSGIWALDEPVVMCRHHEILHESLGLPQELAIRFDEWIANWHQGLVDTDCPGHREFIAQGRQLAQDLKRFVGPDVVVLYASEADPGKDETINLD